MSKVQKVTAQQWRKWIEDNNGVVLDVREPGEWRLGTLPDAVLMSMGDIPSRIGELNPAQALLVVCRSGNRSHQVARYLSHIGHQKVADLVGGMKALGLQD